MQKPGKLQKPVTAGTLHKACPHERKRTLPDGNVECVDCRLYVGAYSPGLEPPYRDVEPHFPRGDDGKPK